MKGFLIAATKSSSGKTTLTLGLLAALMKRGISVAPFKVGPDFIDPGHHFRITGRVSRNLDGWMLARDYNQQCFALSSRQVDIAVVEGVMGLYDGYDGKTEAGSSAQMAKWLGLPVVLIVDVKSMARSAAALIQGFERFDPDLTFAGVIFNRLGSERHLAYLKDAVEGSVNMPILGGLYHDESISIPERHLGLVTQDDHPLGSDMIAQLASFVERHVAIDKLVAILPEIPLKQRNDFSFKNRPVSRVRIGVARDNAFCFYYQDNFDLLNSFGAEPIFFSPMFDEKLPKDIDGIYLGGGYPELFAAVLAKNGSMRSEIRERAADGMPIYGECGGFMYLCKEIQDIDGNVHPMIGCFPFTTRMFSKLKSLGYREVTLETDTLLGPAGQKIRGHEFHYSDLNSSRGAVEKIYKVATRFGVEKTREGYRVGRCLGSYIHLHFGSCPSAAQFFVKACADYQRERV
jgi:cobyrinic acid a,c-diamide synthase